MTINEIRKLFPFLQNGIVYFNHAALGPLSSKVVEKINSYTEERSCSNIMNYESFIEVEKHAKRKLGRLLNSPESRIAWIDNVSNAMNLIAQALGWEKGDRVIINDVEFPANVYPFLNLKKQGVEIDFVKANNGIVTTQDIEKVISHRTKLISVSLVQFLSGYKIDINLLGKICRERNIILCVDAIQGAGAVKINVDESNIDFLAGGVQKWIMALQGLSYFYISEKLQNSINQKYVGWSSVENSWDFLDYKLTLKKSAERFQSGTLNAIGITALDASLDLLESYGYGEIEKIISDNTKYFIQKLNENGIDTLMNLDDAERLSGIVSFKVNNPQSFFNKLLELKINCALREGIIRMSPHFYNTKEEIDFAVEAVKRNKN